MTLSIPRFLEEANIRDDTIHYPWDDWNEEQAEQVRDDMIVSRLEAISKRAVLAFMCGSAEWIVYRMSKLFSDPLHDDFLQAAWAMNVNVRYSGYGSKSWVNVERGQWAGPVKRPIAKAFHRVEDSLQQFYWEWADPVYHAISLTSLATYVMVDPTAYQTWCDRILNRFTALYPLNIEDEAGDVVPRVAVDPEYDFQIQNTEALVNEYLSGLDHENNIFLSPPQGMIEVFDEEGNGFLGTPYEFDIELDRQNRVE